MESIISCHRTLSGGQTNIHQNGQHHQLTQDVVWWSNKHSSGWAASSAATGRCLVVKQTFIRMGSIISCHRTLSGGQTTFIRMGSIISCHRTLSGGQTNIHQNGQHNQLPQDVVWRRDKHSSEWAASSAATGRCLVDKQTFIRMGSIISCHRTLSGGQTNIHQNGQHHQLPQDVVWWTNKH